MSAPAEFIHYRDASTEALQAAAWRAGSLDWLLHSDQLSVYRQYRAWEAQPTAQQAGQHARVFVLSISRRWGKSTLCLILLFETALRKPGSQLTYATAYQKDIADMLIPLARRVSETAPPDCRPEYRVSKQGETGGFYFGNGSSIKLVGLDRNPDGLRGRASDGVVIAEAGYVDQLKPAVLDVLYPQLQGRPHARIILESSAPEEPETDFDDTFYADAKLRGALAERTILDNPLLPPEERDEFIRAAGGRGHPRCEREYFNARTRDSTRIVVQEFDPKEHVRVIETPQYADCYVSYDPGIRDLAALLFAFYDFKRAKLCIQAEFAERNVGTPFLADVIRETEARLWSNTTSWNGKEFRPQPYLRVSDHGLQQLLDLRAEHGIGFTLADKTQGAKTELREANVNSLRTAFADGQIEIDPSCVKLIGQLSAGLWNKDRTDYQRSEVHGHLDLIDALVYLRRSVVRSRNPYPPDYLGKTNVRVLEPENRKTRAAAALEKAYGLMVPKTKNRRAKKDHSVPRL